jgi:hypothetical protein
MHKEAQLFFCAKGEGFMLKVARLWQVIVLAMSICEVKITCRPAPRLDLHPAGLEPATL